MISTIVIYLISTLIFVAIWNIIVNYNLYKLARNLPGNEDIWIVELIKIILIPRRKFAQEIHKFLRKDMPFTKIWFGNYLTIFSGDPIFINKILQHPDCYNKPKRVYRGFLNDFSLLTLNGSQHRNDRKILNKAFSNKSLLKFSKTFDEISGKILDLIDEKSGDAEFDSLNFTGAYALQSSAKTFLNYDYEFYGTEILDALTRFFTLSSEFTQHRMFNLRTEHLRFFKKGRAILDNFDIILEFIKRLEESARDQTLKEENSYLKLLIDPQNGFSEQSIRDHILGSIITFDTTAKTLTAILSMLGMHQDIQSKLRNEIDEIWSQNESNEFTKEFLDNFIYLNSVVKEALRLFTIVPIIARETSNDVDIDGYIIPKGTFIALSIYTLHRDEKFWGSDANVFKPERFLQDLEHPNAFIPFSVGRRICIGYNYSIIGMKIFLINFLRRFQVFSRYKPEDFEMDLSMVVSFVRGHQIFMKRRY